MNTGDIAAKFDSSLKRDVSDSNYRSRERRNLEGKVASAVV
jgi:hypothetical protein